MPKTKEWRITKMVILIMVVLGIVAIGLSVLLHMLNLKLERLQNDGN